MPRTGKKQKASSKYKKLDLNPEEEALYAAANANKNNTTEEEEKALNHAAIERDNKTEFANWVKDHPNMIDSSMVATSGETPQTTNGIPTIPQSPADTYAAELTKEAEGIQNKIDGTNEVPDTGAANTALTDSVAEVTTPKKDDPPGVQNSKYNYNKAMMSIWDAHREGLIDKETAGYFTIDAIATLAKNLGRSIGNVGAQFSGGTIDNGHDTSMWEQRRDSMFGTELQKETEGIDTFDNKFKQLSYNRSSTLNDLIEVVKSDADKLSDNNPLKIAYLSLAAMIASGQVDGTTTLAATGAKGITELFNLFKRKDKK